MSNNETIDFTAVFHCESLEELAQIFDGLAEAAFKSSKLNGQQSRAASLAFAHAASITRRTVMEKKDAKS